MKRDFKQHLFKLRFILFFLLISWIVGLDKAEAYIPINDLIASVDQLYQSGEIFDLTVKTNLNTSLQNISTLVDSGNRITAKELLAAFTQEVNSLSGVLISSAAASLLVNAVTTISAGL